MVPRRRRRPSARTAGEPHRHHPARQEQPDFTPHEDTGDFVIVVNAAKMRLTGNKLDGQGLLPPHRLSREACAHASPAGSCASKPERLLHKAVAGMLPKNRLGRRLLTKLKVYTGAEHPHAAQKPVVAEVVVRSHHGRTERDFAATGKRKTAVARVRVTRRIGQIVTVNRRALEELLRPRDVAHDRAPAVRGHRDHGTVRRVWSTSTGGGVSAQAAAIRHGITRALVADQSRAPPGA